MLQQRLKPDVGSYNALVSVSAKAEDQQRACHVSAEILQQCLKLDVIRYNVLVSA